MLSAPMDVPKIPSTPADPGAAVRRGVHDLAGDRAIDVLADGTTVATNAVLERSGARVALVTTEGFRRHRDRASGTSVVV